VPELKRSAEIALRVEGEAETQGVGDQALRELEAAELGFRTAAGVARSIVERVERMNLEGL
jgi:hypothetical protein